MAGYFSNAKLLVIPQAGHIALCDQPTEATDEGRRTVFCHRNLFKGGWNVRIVPEKSVEVT